MLCAVGRGWGWREMYTYNYSDVHLHVQHNGKHTSPLRKWLERCGSMLTVYVWLHINRYTHTHRHTDSHTFLHARFAALPQLIHCHPTLKFHISHTCVCPTPYGIIRKYVPTSAAYLYGRCREILFADASISPRIVSTRSIVVIAMVSTFAKKKKEDRKKTKLCGTCRIPHL